MRSLVKLIFVMGSFPVACCKSCTHGQGISLTALNRAPLINQTSPTHITNPSLNSYSSKVATYRVALTYLCLSFAKFVLIYKTSLARQRNGNFYRKVLLSVVHNVLSCSSYSSELTNQCSGFAKCLLLERTSFGKTTKC